MERDKNDYKKATLELLILWMDKCPYLDEEAKKLWFEMGLLYQDNMEFIVQLLDNIDGKRVQMRDEKRGVFYRYGNNSHFIEYQNYVMTYSDKEIKELLQGVIELLSDILPLGSVVEVKSEALFIPDHVEIEPTVTFVVTQRFLSVGNSNTYYEYAGVPYPVGMIEADEVVLFTNRAIEKVVFEGYTEEADKNYICTMKELLLLKERKRTAAFSKK